MRRLRRPPNRGPRRAECPRQLYNRGLGVIEDQNGAVTSIARRRIAVADAQSNPRMPASARCRPDSAKAAALFRMAPNGNAAGESPRRGIRRQGVPGLRRPGGSEGRREGRRRRAIPPRRCYRDGEGVEHDLIEAHRWMNAAARTRTTRRRRCCSRGRDELAKRMTVEQVSKHRSVREWFRRHEGSNASAAQCVESCRADPTHRSQANPRA